LAVRDWFSEGLLALFFLLVGLEIRRELTVGALTNVTGGLTPERVVDNITLHWLTNTAASSARLYWENFRAIFAALAAGKKPANLSVPVAFTVFPSEIFQAPRSWAEKVYPNLIYFNEAEKGGHFAAWEEPAIFARELRAAFSSLR
jgi:pimeloyl-ACP methyl ester carboxylesterase